MNKPRKLLKNHSNQCFHASLHLAVVQAEWKSIQKKEKKKKPASMSEMAEFSLQDQLTSLLLL